MIKATLILFLSFWMFASEAGRTNCTFTSPEIDRGRVMELLFPRYLNGESCADAQKRAFIDWINDRSPSDMKKLMNPSPEPVNELPTPPPSSGDSAKKPDYLHDSEPVSELLTPIKITPSSGGGGGGPGWDGSEPVSELLTPIKVTPSSGGGGGGPGWDGGGPVSDLPAPKNICRVEGGSLNCRQLCSQSSSGIIAYKGCVRNSDCVIVPGGVCESCDKIAVHKQQEGEYRLALERAKKIQFQTEVGGHPVNNTCPQCLSSHRKEAVCIEKRCTVGFSSQRQSPSGYLSGSEATQ